MFRQDEDFTIVMWRKGHDEDTSNGTISTSNSISGSTSKLALQLVAAYVLFMKKCYHLQEEYLEALGKERHGHPLVILKTTKYFE